MAGVRRRARGSTYLLVMLFLLAPGLRALAGGSAEQSGPVEVVQDTSGTFRVVVGAIVAPSVAPSMRPTLESLAELLRDQVRRVPAHSFSPDRQLERARYLITQREQALERARDARFEILDRNTLRGTTVDPSTRQADAALRDAELRLTAVRAMDPTSIAIPTDKPIELLDVPILFLPTMQAPERLFRAHNADQLFSIYAEFVGDFLLVDVWVQRVSALQPELVGAVAAPPHEIGTAFERLSTAITTAVAGTELAAITAEVFDPSYQPFATAELFLNDRLIGVGRVREEALIPGRYNVRARGPGGVQRVTTLELRPGENREVSLILPRAGEDLILLTTEPSGVEVYRGARFVGQTPLFVPRPIYEQVYTFSARGFFDSRAIVGPDSVSPVRRWLISDGLDHEALVQTERRRFYRSFALFALSVAVPVTLYGMYQNIGGLFPNGQLRTDIASDEATRLFNQANAIYYGYYGSIALSGTLFANMIVRIVRYIRAGQGYHVR